MSDGGYCHYCKRRDCACSILDVPEVKSHLDTWAPYCGASRATFTGHFLKVVRAVLAAHDVVVPGLEPKP